MESGAKQGGSHFWPAVGAVAAVIGASGALIGGLAAAGVFDDDASPPPPTGSPTSPTTTGPVVTVTPTEPPPTVAARVAATLVYNQGVTGCSPTFDLSIGDRSYTPIGVRFQMNDLSTGVQEYTASGAVTCLDGTGCIASGGGVVDVAAGRTFEIVWEEVAFGECTLTLF